jgi:hypothetical protein
VLSGLRVKKIRVGGGEIQILGGSGGVLFAHRIVQTVPAIAG